MNVTPVHIISHCPTVISLVLANLICLSFSLPVVVVLFGCLPYSVGLTFCCERFILAICVSLWGVLATGAAKSTVPDKCKPSCTFVSAPLFFQHILTVEEKVTLLTRRAPYLFAEVTLDRFFTEFGIQHPPVVADWHLSTGIRSPSRA